MDDYSSVIEPRNLGAGGEGGVRGSINLNRILINFNNVEGRKEVIIDNYSIKYKLETYPYKETTINIRIKRQGNHQKR